MVDCLIKQITRIEKEKKVKEERLEGRKERKGKKMRERKDLHRHLFSVHLMLMCC